MAVNLEPKSTRGLGCVRKGWCVVVERAGKITSIEDRAVLVNNSQTVLKGRLAGVEEDSSACRAMDNYGRDLRVLRRGSVVGATLDAPRVNEIRWR